MFDQARSLDLAQKSLESYSNHTPPPFNAALLENTDGIKIQSTSVAVNNDKCWNCGNNLHPRSNCPARNKECSKCSRKGHFAKWCRSSLSTNKPSANSASASLFYPMLASIAPATPESLRKSTSDVFVNGFKANALIDSGSTESFIHPKVAQRHSLPVISKASQVSMASTSLSSKVKGYCEVTLKVNGKLYLKQRLGVLENLCVDIILGLDFQAQHECDI